MTTTTPPTTTTAGDLALRCAEPAPGELVWEWSFDFPAPPERVWPLVSDTQRINRAIGLPSWRFTESQDPLGGSKRTGAFELMGLLAIAWDEHPYEWVAPREMGVVRSYTSGPLTSLRSHVRLAATEAGTRLTHLVAVVPRGLMGSLAARVEVGSKARAGFARVYARIAEHLAGGGASAYPPEAPRLTAEGPALLERGRAALVARGFEAPLVDAFVEHLRGAGDRELLRVRPYALAKGWSTAPVTALRLCLHGVREGLLELTWDLVCPSCRGAKERRVELAELPDAGHCGSCDVRFDATFDRSVEVTFRPSATVRTLESGDYCVGGPGNTRHVVAQRRVPPRGRATIAVELEAGEHRLRGPRSATQALLHVAFASLGPQHASPSAEWVLGVRAMAPRNSTGHGSATSALATQGAAADAELRVTIDARATTVAPERARPGPATLVVENEGDVEQLLLVERTAWADDVTTARDVTCLQEFRDLFSSQILKPGARLKIASVALLFTDLKSSTAMYEQVGDAPAWSLVRDHFDVLFESVVAEEGGIVKTIGDAVMATFVNPVRALRCALAMQARIARYNAEKKPEVPIHLKVGLHAGPCLAVTLNERLDYFGTTVNLSARIQGESVGDDIVVLASLLEQPGVAEVLAAHPHRKEPFQATLKGLSGTFDLVRLWPTRS